MESCERTYEEYQARLSRNDIEGVRFPRTRRNQFRGIRDSLDQFTVPKVLRAIGGDPTPTIGSRLLWLAQSVLVRSERLDAGKPVLIRRRRLGLPTPAPLVEAVLSEHGIPGDVQTLLACQAGYNERDATVYARDLSLKALRHLESKWRDKITRYLFAYNTPEFASYGDNAGWIHVYSTLYPSIAQSYGSKVLVFANVANKTLDLNYWNFRENKGIWSSHNGDRSEFLTAVNIAPEAVIGIWKTDETNRDIRGRDKMMRERTLSYALMRLDVDDVHYAAILDARTVGCVMQVGTHFEGCHDKVSREWAKKDSDDVSQIELGPLIPDGKPLPVIAVVRACAAEDAACAIPDSVLGEMPTAATRLTCEERSEFLARHLESTDACSSNACVKRRRQTSSRIETGR